ncbi:ABC transporter permease subunit [Desertibaculum subflavum]|uniref:ABC transporter permease subunit n=1 Tax=Desertibaculum subflavum TaxID=2268458 RepID=UPI000E66396A
MSANWGLRLAVLLPALWLVLFVAWPLLIVAEISFSEVVSAIPPYLPVFGWSESGPSVSGNVENYRLLASDALYTASLLTSLRIAAVATALTLLIGLPIAHGIARAEPRFRGALLLLVILPFWTSFLIRVYAWIGILKNEGLLNELLLALGLIDQPLTILTTEWAIHLGIVYAYLPFMVLPLYVAIERIDPALREAAADLGARGTATFFRITLPLARPGIAAGCLLVFIPAMGEFVIPDLLGGPNTLMIGKTLWVEFFANRDWPVAAALAVVLLVLVLVGIAALDRAQRRAGEGLA